MKMQKKTKKTVFLVGLVILIALLLPLSTFGASTNLLGDAQIGFTPGTLSLTSVPSFNFEPGTRSPSPQLPSPLLMFLGTSLLVTLADPT